MFFESLAECSLGFTYVCVAAVDVTRDVLSLGCTTIKRRVFAGLLFVLGGLFALHGGGASAHSGYPFALRSLWTCASSDFLSSAVVTYCCALLMRVRTTESLRVRG